VTTEQLGLATGGLNTDTKGTSEITALLVVAFPLAIGDLNFLTLTILLVGLPSVVVGGALLVTGLLAVGVVLVVVGGVLGDLASFTEGSGLAGIVLY